MKNKKIILPIVVIAVLLVVIILIVFLNRNNGAGEDNSPKEKIVSKEFQYEDKTLEFGIISTAKESGLSESDVWILEDREKGFKAQARVYKTSISKEDFLKYYIADAEMQYSYYNTTQKTISCGKDFTCTKIIYKRKEPTPEADIMEEKTYIEVVAFYPYSKKEYLTVIYTIDDSTISDSTIEELISSVKIKEA